MLSQYGDTESKPVVKRRGRLRAVIFLLLLIVSLGGLWCYWLWKSEPEYWQHRADFRLTTPINQRRIIAQTVEQRILERLDVALANGRSATVSSSQVDGSVEEELFLTFDEINVWIDERLDDWIANQGAEVPGFLKDPMLAAEGQNLIVAFEYVNHPFRQVVSMISRVNITDGGEAVIRVQGVRAGCLPIPGAKAVSQAVVKGGIYHEGFSQVADHITEAFDGRTFDPVLKVHNQKVRLSGFELKPSGARLSIQAAAPTK